MSKIVTIQAYAAVKLKVKLTDSGELDDVIEILDIDDIEDFTVVE